MIKNTISQLKYFNRVSAMQQIFKILLLFFFAGQIYPQQNDFSKEIFKADSILNAAVSENSPGYALMIIKNNQVLLSKGYGLRNIEKHEKINPNSSFYLASLSKQFTGMAYGILLERGMIDLEDYVTKYIPDFPVYGKEIKIKHLLSHTSGLPDYYSFIGEDISEFSNKDVYKIITERDSLLFPPGESYSYSNSGYVLLSILLEKITGEKFSDFMRENIFEPLDMENTLVHDESKPGIKNKAVGYSQDASGNFIINDYNLSTTGAGGIFSTLNDLFKWDEALYTEKLVKKSTMEKMLTPFKLNNGESSNYGFGWMIREFKEGKNEGKTYYVHTGSLKGFRNIIIRYPEESLTLVCLSNSGKPLENAADIFKMFLND